MLIRHVVLAMSAIAGLSAAQSANGTVSGPTIDRAILVESSAWSTALFGYGYNGTIPAPARFNVTNARPGTIGSRDFTLIPGRQYQAFKVDYGTTVNSVGTIDYDYLNPATGAVERRRKGTGTAPILKDWTVPSLIAVAVDPADANYLIATFRVATRTGGSLPYPVEVLTNVVAGGTVVGALPVDFRAPKALALTVRFHRLAIAAWYLDNDVVQASIADLPNRPPVIADLAIDTPIGTRVHPLPVHDPDGDALAIEVLSTSQISQVTVQGTALQIRAHDYGIERWVVRATDARGASATATVAVASWIPYTTAQGADLDLKWKQFWVPGGTSFSAGERQYTVVSDGQVFDPAWGTTLTHRNVGPTFGHRGTGIFAEFLASKIPFGDVYIDMTRSLNARAYTVISHVDIPAGMPVQVTSGHPDAHAYTRGFLNGQVVHGEPLMKLRIVPADGQIWVLPAIAPLPTGIQ